MLLRLLLLAAACNAQMTMTVLGVYSNGAMLRNSSGIRLAWQNGGTWPGTAMVGFASPPSHLITTSPRSNGARVKSYDMTVGLSSGSIVADMTTGFTDPDPAGTLYAYKTVAVVNNVISYANIASQPFYIVPVPLTRTVISNIGGSLSLRIDFNLGGLTPTLNDKITIFSFNNGVLGGIYQNAWTVCSCRLPSSTDTIPKATGSWTFTLSGMPVNTYIIKFGTMLNGLWIYAPLPGLMQFDGTKWIVT